MCAELPTIVGSYEAARREFAWRLPERYNIAYDVCDRHAGRGLPAAVHVGAVEVERLSFDDLKRSSDELAGLLASRGVGRGDRVCTLLRNTPDGVIAALAILKLGAIVAPLSLEADVDALRMQVSAVRPRAAIRDEQASSAIPDLLGTEAIVSDGHGWRDGWGHQWDGQPPSLADTKPDDPAVICFTSGSTGAPKPVVLAHRFVLSALPAFQFLTALGPHDDEVLLASLGWSGLSGWRPIIFAAWHFGRPVVVRESGVLDAQELCRTLASERVTCAHMMPAAIKRLRDVDDPDLIDGLHALRVLYYAGEPLGPDLQATLERRFSIEIRPYYGATESAFLACGCPGLFEHRPGSVGRVVPGHDVTVLDEASGHPVEAGGDGVIAVSADDPGLLLEYLDRPDLTEQAFAGGRFLTGDIGHLDSDGTLWYVGRRGEVITTPSGEAVPATRIEDVALSFAEVADAVAVQVSQADRHPILLYLVTREPVDESAFSRRLREALAAALGDGLVPERVVRLDDFPRTAGTGKVRRSVLRAHALRELQAEPA